jgi:hypothetical protein
LSKIAKLEAEVKMLKGEVKMLKPLKDNFKQEVEGARTSARTEVVRLEQQWETERFQRDKQNAYLYQSCPGDREKSQGGAGCAP